MVKFNCLNGIERRGRLNGIIPCSLSPPEQGEGAFIKAGAIIRTFAVFVTNSKPHNTCSIAVLIMHM